MPSSVEYTVRGTIKLDPAWPVEEIGLALMDCAHDEDAKHDFAISMDLALAEIEIECIIGGQDSPDALANASIAIYEICSCADLPIRFVNDEKPCPSIWHVEPSEPQTLALASQTSESPAAP